MTAIQHQPSGSAPMVKPNPIANWWMTLKCQKAEVFQNIGDKETGKIYRIAWWKTKQILGQVFRLLMLIGLTIIGIFVGLWLICFNQGLKLRQELEVDEPTPQNILWKLAMVLFIEPCQRFFTWLKDGLKREFGWDLG
jgi:hypothetical protein